MVTIAKANDVVTLINVFTVAPEDQQRLVDVLVEATQAVMRTQPGFVSANIHKSLDGTRVTNYAVKRRLRLCFEIKKLPSTWGRRLG
jgi:antibiotic biosynthesis monooxygenase (ABM) superfamily enzyme